MSPDSMPRLNVSTDASQPIVRAPSVTSDMTRLSSLFPHDEVHLSIHKLFCNLMSWQMPQGSLSTAQNVQPPAIAAIEVSFELLGLKTELNKSHFSRSQPCRRGSAPMCQTKMRYSGYFLVFGLT